MNNVERVMIREGGTGKAEVTFETEMEADLWLLRCWPAC